MKTRVASVILDTHSQDIDSVADYAEDVSAGASEATSEAILTFEENLSEYASTTGDSLSIAFSASSITLANMSLVADGQQEQINSNSASAVTRANQLESVSNRILRDMAKDTMQGSRDRVYWGVRPRDPRSGDILWNIPRVANPQSDDEDDLYDWGEAKPQKYLVDEEHPGGDWVDIEYTKELFGSKIHGAEIHAGKIFGLELISSLNNFYHRPVFSLSKDGWVYAQNLTTDIFNAVSSGHNGRSYDNGMTNPDIPEKNRGFNMMNGIMSFKAMAHRNDTSVSDVRDYYAQTFLEPDMIKFRSYYGMFDGAWDKDSDPRLIARTDIQSGRIDINSTFSDESGFMARPTEVRVGLYKEKNKDDDDERFGILKSHYINTNSLHILGTGLTIEANGTKPTISNSGVTEFNDVVYAKNGIIVTGGNVKLENGKVLKGSGTTTSSDDDIDAKSAHINGGKLKIDESSNPNDTTTFLNNGYSRMNKTLTVSNGNVDIKNGQLLVDQMVFARSGIFVEYGGIKIQKFRYWNGSSPGLKVESWGEFDEFLTSGGEFKHKLMTQISDKSVKKNFKEMDSEKVLSQLVATDIVKYNYKDPNNKDADFIGPVIDDVDEEKEYYIPEELVSRGEGKEHNTLITNNYISYLTLGIKELAKQNQQLMFRLAKLEREGK